VREVNSNPALSECVTDWRERPGNGEWPSGTGGRMGSVQSGRNCRNVWTIATQAFPGSHFATMPAAVVERCIKAGTSERGCCAACGAPWRRTTDVAYVKSPVHGSGSVIGRHELTGANGWDGAGLPRLNKHTTTTGWSASCACSADVVPATVLDCFAGAGTTLLVADRLQRNAIGVELNASYTTMAMDRCRADAPLFSSWAPAEDPADARMAAGAKQRDMFDQC
jgi:hypothetical protein